MPCPLPKHAWLCKRPLRQLAAGLLLALPIAPLFAAPDHPPLDLLASYEAALSQDPEYQMARASAEAGRELLPLARAQLLPNLSFNATHLDNRLTSESIDILGRTTVSRAQYPSKNYALVLRQPLYRPQLMAGFRQARARTEGVEAAFEKAGQDMALRVMGAYFNVLLAEESLRQFETQQRAISAQLAAAQRALHVGHGTRTDIDDAQARFDMNQARLLGAKQRIAQTRHELEILINTPAGALRPLDPARLPTSPPQPESLDEWIARAENQNPELRDMRARVEAARHEVARARAGHKPTLDLIAQRTIRESDDVTQRNTSHDNTQVGLQLAVPLFAGGHVSAQVRQMRAALDEAKHRMETVRRKLAAQVRKEYQGVREGAERVRALTAAVHSADQAVRSNIKGLQAGTRSSIDLLNAEESRANARIELLREQLVVILAHARLLSLGNTLDRDAVAEINGWLAE